MVKAASAAMDAVSSDLHIHFGEIEKSRRKEVMGAHGDVAGELLCCFDLDRLGSEDASILVTDQWISFRSISGILMGTNLTLKVHWSWCRAVVRKDDHIEFSLREPADAPPLCVPWKSFFDDREAELHLLVEFLDAILQHNLTGGGGAWVPFVAGIAGIGRCRSQGHAVASRSGNWGGSHVWFWWG